MNNMEIEKKFTIKKIPDNLEQYPCAHMEQGYLSTDPVVRVRRENDSFYLTYKGSGMFAHEEYNLPLTQSSYEHLLTKCDGNIIRKKRYRIPYEEYTIELDLFDHPFEDIRLAEVEFPDIEKAGTFIGPDWFDQEVTFEKRYHNSYLSTLTLNR